MLSRRASITKQLCLYCYWFNIFYSTAPISHNCCYSFNFQYRIYCIILQINIEFKQKFQSRRKKNQNTWILNIFCIFVCLFHSNNNFYCIFHLKNASAHYFTKRWMSTINSCNCHRFYLTNLACDLRFTLQYCILCIMSIYIYWLTKGIRIINQWCWIQLFSREYWFKCCYFEIINTDSIHRYKLGYLEKLAIRVRLQFNLNGINFEIQLKIFSNWLHTNHSTSNSRRHYTCILIKNIVRNIFCSNCQQFWYLHCSITIKEENWINVCKVVFFLSHCYLWIQMKSKFLKFQFRRHSLIDES